MTVAITGHLSDGSEVTIFNDSDSIFKEMFDVCLDFLKIQKQLVLFAHVYNVPMLQHNLFHKWTCSIKHFLILKHYNYLMDLVLDNVFTHFTLIYDNTVPTDDYLYTKILYGSYLSNQVEVPYNKLEDLHNFLNFEVPTYIDSIDLYLSSFVTMNKSNSESVFTLKLRDQETSQFTIS